MKTYTTIPQEISKLNLSDIYRFTCLTFTPRKHGYTDSTFEQIKDITKDNSERTIQDFVQRLRDSELIEIDTITTLGISGRIVSRNHYFIPDYQENFRRIHNSFLDVELDMYEKGFLIAMFTLCLNGTKICELKQKVIAKKLNISESQVSKYIKSLTTKGYIQKTSKRIVLKVEGFLRFSTKQLNQIEILKNNSKFNDIICKTDWDNVVDVDSYLLAIETGTINIKVEEKINEEIIL